MDLNNNGVLCTTCSSVHDNFFICCLLITYSNFFICVSSKRSIFKMPQHEDCNSFYEDFTKEERVLPCPGCAALDPNLKCLGVSHKRRDGEFFSDACHTGISPSSVHPLFDFMYYCSTTLIPFCLSSSCHITFYV